MGKLTTNGLFVMPEISLAVTSKVKLSFVSKSGFSNKVTTPVLTLMENAPASVPPIA